MNQSSPHDEKWRKYFAAGVIGTLSLSGLIAYILVFTVILRHRQIFAKNSYYTLLTSLALSDSILLSLYLFYAVPCVVLQKFILGEGFDISIGVIFNIAYFSCLACISTIGINRYWAVCRFDTFDERFKARNTKICVGCIWTFGLIFGFFQAHPCCPLRFFFETYSFKYDMNCWGNAYFKWFDRFATIITVSINVLCYYRILRKKPGQFKPASISPNSVGSRLNVIQQQKRKNVERNLAMQFGVIIIILIVAGLSFTTVPELTSNRWFTLLDSVLYILNNGCNPFVYLIFNSAIRAQFFEMYCGRMMSPT